MGNSVVHALDGVDLTINEGEFVVCTFGLDNGIYSEVIQGLEPGIKVYTKLPRKSEDK